jgi:Transposase
MGKGTTYVALDDSKRRIVAGILRPADTEPELREIPNDPQHVRRLVTRLMREGAVKACYEAGVSGYDLYRRLTALGVACEVIAPALTPRRPGQGVKTDRRDAAKLVRFFRAGELTAIHVPDETEEAGRDLVRCRDDIRRDVLRWRHRVLKLLARHGRVYLAGKNWSQVHWRWIRSQQFDQPPLQRAFEATPPAVVAQAWRAQQRLHRRYRHLVGHGKLSPVAVAAVARELVGFIWAAMTDARVARQRRRKDRVEGLTTSFQNGVGPGAMRARLESPRASYATPGFRIGTTRAPRRRQLPTKRCHAALPSGAIRVYQPDSSSKPPHRQPGAGAFGKPIPIRVILGHQHRLRGPTTRKKSLDGRSFHIS